MGKSTFDNLTHIQEQLSQIRKQIEKVETTPKRANSGLHSINHNLSNHNLVVHSPSDATIYECAVQREGEGDDMVMECCDNNEVILTSDTDLDNSGGNSEVNEGTKKNENNSSGGYV